MRIVYVGQLWKGGTCRMRMEALTALGHDVIPVDTTPPAGLRGLRALVARAQARLGRPPDAAGANARICQALDAGGADVLWIDKGLTIRPSTLAYARRRRPRPLIASFSPDDMARPRNQSRWYVDGLPLFDVHFTTKTFNVAELQELGAREVVFVGNGFDPAAHRPITVSADEQGRLGGPVGFVGACERERAAEMLALARAGIPVRVWGWGDWAPWRGRHPLLRVENRPLWGDEYARALASFRVNLCFLRKLNRDRQTTRSIEIPACGAFMLAERTEEHLELFEEGREAEFFGSRQELIDKLRFYLTHDEARRRIAEAGRRRCVRSGYDYPSRMRWMLRRAREGCAG